MGKLQHNKIIVVDGDKVQAVVCGSTNHSWRGFFVQNNNAIILRGKQAVKIFRAAFDAYWNNSDDVAGFGATGSAIWNDLKLKGIDAQIGFSPRSKKNAVLDAIAKDIGQHHFEPVFLAGVSLSDSRRDPRRGDEDQEGQPGLLLRHLRPQGTRVE